jgi:hypothetical protein
MSTDSQQIVNKAWNFAHVLRDDGLSYMAYARQIASSLMPASRASWPRKTRRTNQREFRLNEFLNDDQMRIRGRVAMASSHQAAIPNGA